MEDKTSNLVHRADARLFKSRTLGGIWAKIRRTDETVDKKDQIATNDDFEQAAKSAVNDKEKDEISAVSISLTDEKSEDPIGFDDEEDIADANTKSTTGSKLSPQKVLANENSREAGMYHDAKV